MAGPPCRRIDVLHLDAVAGVPIAVCAQVLEGLVGVVERIREHGRRSRAAAKADGQQVAPVAEMAVSGWDGGGIRRLRVMLRETGAQEADQRHVEHVEPNRRLPAFVAMLVPRPRRRDDEVARSHVAALARDGRISVLAFDDETQRRGRVAMRARELAGQDQLQAGIERVGREMPAGESWVLEHQHAAFRLGRRDDGAGLHDDRPQVGITPHVRDCCGARLGGEPFLEKRPERHEARSRDALPQPCFGRLSCRIGRERHARPSVAAARAAPCVLRRSIPRNRAAYDAQTVRRTIGAMMTSRREFLKVGLAASALPVTARAAFAADSSAATVPLYKVLYDTRFAASIAFARRAAARGLAVHAMNGDMTRFWYDDLYYRWQKRPAAIAGLTAHGALFCLERLAWDQRMRVVFRGEHTLAADSCVVHRFEGSTTLLPTAADCSVRHGVGGRLGRRRRRMPARTRRARIGKRADRRCRHAAGERKIVLVGDRAGAACMRSGR